ncbi:putative ankyrin repeat protein RF_0381 [Cloeon dipterum]|uniref:putative ankyrin repeat protein RF_0381 n=1 Tax=Cloeon dipterum TaxID=197152 RepID=UPI00321F734D
MTNKLKSAQFVHRRDKNLLKNYVDSKGQTALHVAAACADEKMCTWLVRVGVSAESPESTVLHKVGYNAAHGSKLTPFFVNMGLDLNERDESGKTPIVHALRAGNLALAETMLDLGADLEIKVGGFNLVHLFLICNNMKAVRYLHRKNKQMVKEILSPQGTNAMHLAATFGDLEMCSLLCKLGFDVRDIASHFRNSVLHFASLNKQFGKSLVPFFVYKGVDVNQRNATFSDQGGPEKGSGLVIKRLFLVYQPNDKQQSCSLTRPVKFGASLSHTQYKILRWKMSSSFMSVQETSRFLEKTTTGLTPLMLAARDSDFMYFLEFVEKSGERADATTEFGVTLLHIAAMNKSDGMDIIRYFTFEAGLDLKKKDADGEEPIHYAVRLADFERAKELLILRNNLSNILHYFVTKNNLKFSKIVHQHDGELVKEFDSKGRLALHIAAEFAGPEMVEWLVCEAGVDVRALSKDKSTALHFAARNTQNSYAGEMVEFFLSKKLNKYAKNESGETPMHAALSVENVNVARDLLDAGVRVKKCDPNILMYCVKINKIESAKFISNRYSHLMKRIDFAGCNLLHIAAEFSNKEMCKWIVSKNKIKPKDLCASELRSTVFHHVAKNKAHGVELVRYFVGLKVDLDKRNKSGETPLQYALQNENLDVADELISNGADLDVKFYGLNMLQFCISRNLLYSAIFVHSKDRNQMQVKGKGAGENALHLAAANADLSMCQWLCNVHFNARFLSEELENSVLHFVACNEKHGQCLVSFFVSKSVDINGRNKNKETPLHTALREENIKVAEELLKFGADINVKIDNDNLLHFCIRRKKLASAKFVFGERPELVTEKCSGGDTALQLALEHADLEFCTFLTGIYRLRHQHR